MQWSYFILTVLISNSWGTPLDQGEDIIGQYWTEGRSGKVELYQDKDRYYGKILWRKEERNDVHNPIKALRDRSVIGIVFLKDFEYRNGKYEKGKVYSIDNGKTYAGKMWLEDRGKTLKMRGYVGVSWLGRTATLERIEP
ncbi:MAG: DUF2147 domain-containing protein [Saprospiraceae bacterium]|nr:DUF2147 domain-containing protein [Saprospiraceae bacterium]